ncbi:MAG: sugar ABC transporter permease [Weeping tea tree witches'-broom phytoplasma]|uniref:carbohydrate ABC transporter permease n=1 Tax=Candidatus Phytoplasma melaleucae TaxID=2982630 RepID=UPI00293A331A|nr:sugar ABC transporter permease [Weeping tea tree witches'-broom phytoplasma]
MLTIKGDRNQKHWYYLLPSLVILTVFTFYPLFKTIIISFNANYDKFNDYFSISIYDIFSFKNYVRVLNDFDFLFALKTTLLLVLNCVPISLTLSLIIALALNSVYNHFLKDIFKTFFLLPLLSNTIIMSMIFGSFFYYNAGISSHKPEGLFNSFFSIFGIKPQAWINISAPYSHKIFVLVFYNVWARLPFKIFVFLLALQDIDKSYYDAAKIDGASKWRIFTKIVLPLLSPVIFYQLIIEMLMVIKEYESVIGVFGKDANFRIQTVVSYIYNQLSSSNYNSYSKGAAAAMILLFISILFTVISFYISKKENKLMKVIF